MYGSFVVAYMLIIYVLVLCIENGNLALVEDIIGCTHTKKIRNFNVRACVTLSAERIQRVKAL